VSSGIKCLGVANHGNSSARRASVNKDVACIK
jgi:hypothetical protein